MPRKLSYEEVKKEIEKTGGKLLSKKYKNAKENLTFECSLCGDDYKNNYDNFKQRRKTTCPKCSKKIGSFKATKTHEQFIEEMKNLVENEYIVMSEYTRALDKVVLKHNCGFEYKVTPANFLNGKRCPKCSGYLGWDKKDTKRFKEEVVGLTGKEYSVMGEYISSLTKINMRHERCGNDYKVTPNDFLSNNRRCPRCNESKGERRIRDFLTKHEVMFKPQYHFHDLKGKSGRVLKFDFATMSNGKLTLIEYDGEFHFERIKNLVTQESFERQKLYDVMKNDYCKDKEIHLVRIPYWQMDEIENILKDAIL